MTFLVSHFSRYASQIQTSLSNALHKCSEETNFWSAKPWQFIWNDKSGKESYFYLRFSPQPGLVPLSLPRPLVLPHRCAACGPPSPFPLSCCPLLRAPLSGAAISREVRWGLCRLPSLATTRPDLLACCLWSSSGSVWRSKSCIDLAVYFYFSKWHSSDL